jgi:succinate dehydrogenase / fumarate reductase cytochrome b subunit
MSSAAINPKGPRVTPAGAGPAAWGQTYLGSTVGQKVIVALTGTLLAGFVVAHMVGNLKMFSGPDSINSYAYFLKHELGVLLWVARGGLLALFITHLALTLNLKAKSAAARPVPYLNLRPAQATLASRTMMWTGLVVGAFVAFHLAHYTLGWVKPAEVRDATTGRVTTIDYLKLTDAQGRHNVYEMTVAGFRTWWVSVIYVVAQVLLFVHLSHGLQSVVQTLGLKGTRFAPAWVWVGYGVAGLILAGNLAIVVAVWTGAIGPQYPLVR